MATSSTKYARITTRLELSRNSDYSDPIEAYEHEDTFTPTRHAARVEFLALTTGSTIDLSAFGAITQVVAHNRDSANYVDVKFRNTPGGVVDYMYVRIQAGGIVMLGSALTIADDILFTANTADCEVCLTILGTA